MLASNQDPVNAFRACASWPHLRRRAGRALAYQAEVPVHQSLQPGPLPIRRVASMAGRECESAGRCAPKGKELTTAVDDQNAAVPAAATDVTTVNSMSSSSQGYQVDNGIN